METISNKTVFNEVSDMELYELPKGDFTISWNWNCDDFEKRKNPFVPEKIYVNEEKCYVTVIWKDKKIKVVCDEGDTFSAEVGFAVALMYKLFDSKTQFKKKWWNIIRKRINWLGNTLINKNVEDEKLRFLIEEETKKKNKKTLANKKERIKELKQELFTLAEPELILSDTTQRTKKKKG